MNLLFFVIGIRATEGGSRPNLINSSIPDYDYVTTLDMFDLLQGLLMKNQTYHNISSQSINQTYHNISNQSINQTYYHDSSYDIATLSVTIISALLNILTIYFVSVSKLPEKTYSAAPNIE